MVCLCASRPVSPRGTDASGADLMARNKGGGGGDAKRSGSMATLEAPPTSVSVRRATKLENAEQIKALRPDLSLVGVGDLNEVDPKERIGAGSSAMTSVGVPRRSVFVNDFPAGKRTSLSGDLEASSTATGNAFDDFPSNAKRASLMSPTLESHDNVDEAKL